MHCLTGPAAGGVCRARPAAVGRGRGRPLLPGPQDHANGRSLRQRGGVAAGWWCERAGVGGAGRWQQLTGLGSGEDMSGARNALLLGPPPPSPPISPASLPVPHPVSSARSGTGGGRLVEGATSGCCCCRCCWQRAAVAVCRSIRPRMTSSTVAFAQPVGRPPVLGPPAAEAGMSAVRRALEPGRRLSGAPEAAAAGGRPAEADAGRPAGDAEAGRVPDGSGPIAMSPASAWAGCRPFGSAERGRIRTIICSGVGALPRTASRRRHHRGERRRGTGLDHTTTVSPTTQLLSSQTGVLANLAMTTCYYYLLIVARR